MQSRLGILIVLLILFGCSTPELKADLSEKINRDSEKSSALMAPVIKNIETGVQKYYVKQKKWPGSGSDLLQHIDDSNIVSIETLDIKKSDDSSLQVDIFVSFGDQGVDISPGFRSYRLFFVLDTKTNPYLEGTLAMIPLLEEKINNNKSNRQLPKEQKAKEDKLKRQLDNELSKMKQNMAK